MDKFSALVRSWYAVVAAVIFLLVMILPGWTEAGSVRAELAPTNPQVFTSSGTINFQGQLTDLGGTPLNGSYNLRFAIYDASSGGNKKWPSTAYEQHLSVAVNGGLFSVQLGSISDLVSAAVFNGGGDRYLQVWVCTTAGAGCSTYDDMGRLPISSSAYAQTLSLPAILEKSDSIALLSINNTGNGPAMSVTSANNTGISGWSTSTTGAKYGVFGQSDSGGGRGVYGLSTGGAGYGVYGYASATSNTHGVFGKSDGGAGAAGVSGYASATTGSTYGVRGESASTIGYGVYGIAKATTGTNYGVYGNSYSTEGFAGYFLGNGADTLYVENLANGRGIQAYAPNDTAIWGKTDTGTGVDGYTTGTSGRGVYGRATATTGTNYGVYGRSDSSTGYAGYFLGNLHTTGNFTAVGSKAFIIDHPLDPANQYLYHYSLEGPQPYNLYRGTVILDGSGSALVQLPAYFEAINTDFSYLLTPIGAAMPNLHVAQEIQGNAFLIAGGQPGMKISWQVTAVRNDPWMRDQGFQTETAKPAEEIGTYLYPQGYGQPAELGRDYMEQTE